MIECGFFDSVDRDRVYRADAMTRPYELLISNGVFATPQGTPSTHLQVYAKDGMNVVVKPGRGIFKDKWLINDDDLLLTITDAEVTLPRIDSIIVKIDTTETVRAGTIEVKAGTPSSTPVAPVMERSSNVYEYRLADIIINPRITNIEQRYITDKRGSADCPWITSLIKQVDTSTLFAQWEDAYNKNSAEFDEWFKTLRDEVATKTMLRSYISVYTTVVDEETLIPIDLLQFNYDSDVLNVYINGLALIPEVDYTIEDSETITLTKPVELGTKIMFLVYKSIDGSDAESVVDLVEQLQGEINIIRNPVKSGSGIIIAEDNATVNHKNSIVAGRVGSATSMPVLEYDSEGHISGVDSVAVYPPTTPGTEGQVWTSDGTGGGKWQTPDETPTDGSTSLITSGAVKKALDDRITVSTSEPTGGEDGDIWIVYKV